MKKRYILGLIVFVLLTSGCACTNKKEEKEELPIVTEASKEVVKEQVVDGIRFRNASLVVTDGMTSFRVTLENTVTTVKKISHLKIIFKDENGLVLKEFNRYDFENMKKGETQNVSLDNISMDLSNTKIITYEIEED